MNQQSVLKRFDREPRCALLHLLKSVLEKVQITRQYKKLPVRVAGLEPARPKTTVFETAAFANYATLAKSASPVGVEPTASRSVVWRSSN